MNSNSAGDIILKELHELSQQNKKLVVGIDGITGVGKTTISNYIEEQNPHILLIHIDDFMTPLEFRTEEVQKLEDPIDFFTHNWFEYDDLRKIIDNFRTGEPNVFKTLAYRKGTRNVPVEYDMTKSILVIEGVLLFHPELIDDFWDYRIYLDGDEEEIRQRRVAREKERWGEKYISEDDQISWFRFILTGLKKYKQIYKPDEKADLLLEITPFN